MADVADAPVARAVLRAAIAWQVRLGAGGVDGATRAAWEHWHGADPEHARAWRQLGALDARLTPAAEPAARAALAGVPARRRRRRVVLGGAAMLVLALWGAEQYWPLRHAGADYLTHTGEIREITLADGTHVHLDTRSAIDVSMDGARRLITLRAGEILVESGHADSRPLEIATPDGTLRPLGTRFIARVGQGGTLLLVLQARVAAQPGRGGHGAVLGAGQQVLVETARLGPVTAAAPNADAWATGRLVVQDARLGDVVDTLRRYRPGHLELAPELADVRVSGTFPLADTDLALAAIAQSHGLTLSMRTPLWASLQR
ncbi:MULTISPECIES: FecR family protein [Cupriavidus]